MMAKGAKRILVAEPIGSRGIEMLREHFEVDDAYGSLQERIGVCDGLIVRSATTVDAALFELAPRLRVVGRAGVGVDNIDIDAATARGVLVVNAPQANVVTAAEHTLALILALARNLPQAHASLVAGRWERSRFRGIELDGKTLGVLGFGRIGQLVTQRAQAFGMRVVAFDPFVAADRFVELGVERASEADGVYAVADFLTIHLPGNDETDRFLDARAFERMRDGVRIVNVARGRLVDEEALVAALDSGKVGGAAIDVFREEPVTEHPLFGHDGVVVTPHLGASTAEATARAGEQTAEQVIGALSGGAVLNALNAPALSSEKAKSVAPFVPLARHLGKLATALTAGGTIDEIHTVCAGRLADEETRTLSLSVVAGVLGDSSARPVNTVNAMLVAEERGIRVRHESNSTAGDLREELSVQVLSGSELVEVSGTLAGPGRAPQISSILGQRFAIRIDRFVTIFLYGDAPGMLGRIGTVFGGHGVNIVSAAVGVAPESGEDLAAGVVTTDREVTEEMVAEIVAESGFLRAHTAMLW